MSSKTAAAKKPAPTIGTGLVQKTVTLTSPKVVEQFTTLRQVADRLVVTNRAQHDEAGRMRDEIKRQIKLAEAGYLDARRVMTDALNKHRQLEKDKCGPAKYFVAHVGQKILEWEQEQDRLAEQRRKDADDRARVQAQRDQDAKVEELRKTAEAAPTKTAATRIVRQANALEKTTVQATSTEQVDGGYDRIAGTRRVAPWRGEVTDIGKVITLLAEGRLQPTLIEFKQIELNRLAAEYQGRLKEVFPGLDATNETKLAG